MAGILDFYKKLKSAGTAASQAKAPSVPKIVQGAYNYAKPKVAPKTTTSYSYKSSGSAPAYSQPSPDYQQQLINAVVNNVQPSSPAFESVMPWEQAFSESQARQAVEAQTSPYFAKMWEDASRGITNDMATRGLIGSSELGRTMNEQRFNLDQQRQQAVEELYSKRQQQARDWYETQRENYYKSPTAYQKPTNFEPQIDIANTLAKYQQAQKQPQDYFQNMLASAQSRYQNPTNYLYRF